MKTEQLAGVLYEAHEEALQEQGKLPVMIEWSGVDDVERAIWMAVASRAQMELGPGREESTS